MSLFRNKRLYYDCAVITVIALLFSLTYCLFIVRNNFAPAGFNGIGTMLEYKLNFNIGYFTIIVNTPLCIFAFFFIDREFAVKTFVFSMAYAIGNIILKQFDLSALQYDAQGIDTIYPVLIAGAMGGFVYGTMFRRNCSTGGADIVAKYISKKDPMLNFFWINFTINAVIAFISIFVYAKHDGNGALILDYKPVCLCMLYCFLNSLVANMIIRGSKSAYKFLIITSHADEIDREILEKLRHSATRVKGKGVYTNSEKDLIICVINKRQLDEFKDILKKYDDTFAFVETVNETIGLFRKSR